MLTVNYLTGVNAMTLQELTTACAESIEFQKQLGEDPEAAMLRLTVPGLCRGRRVEVFPGVFGKNLGHIPIGPDFGAGAELNGTEVYVKVADIQRYLESIL